MTFYIQAGNPSYTGVRAIRADCLGDAVAAAFVEDTEKAVIFWQGHAIPLNYSRDLSWLMDDIVLMLDALLEEGMGQARVSWPDSNFRVEWNMVWIGDYLQIQPHWRKLPGHSHHLLNRLDPLTMDRFEFIREWKPMLGRVLDALEASGTQDFMVPNLSLAHQVYGQIDEASQRYPSRHGKVVPLRRAS